MFHPLYFKTASCTTQERSPPQLCLSRYGSRHCKDDVSGCTGAMSISPRISLQIISSNETRRKSKTNNKFTKLEPVSVPKEISPSKPFSSTRVSPSRGLSLKNRHLSSLLPHTYKTRTQKILGDSSSKQDSAIYVPTIWPINCSPHVCQDIKLACSSTPRKRDKDNCLFRRFSSGQSTSRPIRKGYFLNGSISAELGMDNKSRKVHESTNPMLRIFRTGMGHSKQQCISSRQKDQSSEVGSRTNLKDRNLGLGQRKKSRGKVSFCILCDTARKTAFKKSSKSGKSASATSKETQTNFTNESSSGSVLVAKKSSENSSNLLVSEDSIHDNGRVRHWMGCPSQRKIPQRCLELDTDRLAYQSQGIVRSIPSNPINITSASGETRSHSIRQQNGCFLYTEPGRYQISSINELDNKNSRTCEQTQNRDFCFLSSGNTQRYRRQSLSSENPGRLASLQSGDKVVVSKMGNPSSRSICHSPLKGGLKLCISGCKGQGSTFHRCIQQKLEFRSRMDLPSSGSDSSRAMSSEQSYRQLHTDCTEMGTSILEGRSETQNLRSPDSYPKFTSSSVGCNSESSPSERQKLTLGSLVDTGWSRITSNWDIEDIQLLEGSWRKSSLRTYSAPWKAWVQRCHQRSLDPRKPDPADVAQYLSFLYRTKHLAPGTIKLHKSAIATLADPLKREEISNHPLVKHIIRAIGNDNPPLQKKCIWDVEHLVSWIKDSTINEESLFEVSRQMALILLLTSGRRIHDLTLLKIDEAHLKFNDNSVIFWPEFGSKTDKNSYRQSGWHLTKGSIKNLDPVYWTRTLINLSATRRQARSDLSSLFISTRGVVKSATRTMIAGWVKTALKELNINFSPGSIRSAVASSRKENNVPLDDILRNGNWRSDKNVFKYYFKEIEKQTNAGPVSDLVNFNFKPV